MKCLFTFLSAFIFSFSVVNGQVPNSGFEYWTSTTIPFNYKTPDGWGNLNPTTSPAGIYTSTLGSPGYTGAHYLKLTSQFAFAGVVPGVAVTGTINPGTFQPQTGFAINTRPQSLTGAWQYLASATSDQGRISVLLSKWNATTNKKDTVAFANQLLTGMVMLWAPFTIPLTYYSGQYPDSGIILLSASNLPPANATAGSYLYVDTLAFSGNVPSGITTLSNHTPEIHLYPNPAADYTNISCYRSSAGDIKISVVDFNGKKVAELNSKTIRGNNTFPLNVSKIARGIYILRIADDQGIEEKKLIVE
jgi:hypothetical protein